VVQSREAVGNVSRTEPAVFQGRVAGHTSSFVESEQPAQRKGPESPGKESQEMRMRSRRQQPTAGSGSALEGLYL